VSVAPVGVCNPDVVVAVDATARVAVGDPASIRRERGIELRTAADRHPTHAYAAGPHCQDVREARRAEGERPTKSRLRVGAVQQVPPEHRKRGDEHEPDDGHDAADHGEPRFGAQRRSSVRRGRRPRDGAVQAAGPGHRDFEVLSAIHTALSPPRLLLCARFAERGLYVRRLLVAW